MAWGQTAYPKKYGQVSVAEVQERPAIADSNSHAVVLQEIVRIETDLSAGRTVTTREEIKRTKILDANGLHEADVYLLLGENTQLTQLDVRIYTVDAAGKLQMKELERDDIFRERAYSSVKRVRIPIPGVVVGSVVEVRYAIRGYGMDLSPDMYFQEQVPVVYKMFEFKYPEFYQFAMLTNGETEFLLHEKNYESVAGTVHYRNEVQRFTARNVPALLDEPLCGNWNNYRTRIRFTLKEISAPMIPYFAKFAWKEVVGMLVSNNNFGNRFGVGIRGRMREMLPAILAGATTDREKAIAIYRYVQKNIEWDGEKSMFSESLDDLLDKRKASSAGINFLMIALAKEAGLNVHPVVLSTQDHPYAIENYVTTEQFNHTIAAFDFGNQEYVYADARQKGVPFGELPSDDYRNGIVMLVNLEEKVYGFSKLKENYPSLSFTSFRGEISADGKLKGRLSHTVKGAFAHRYRQEKAEKPTTYLQEQVLQLNGLELAADSISRVDGDSLKGGVILEGDIAVEGYATVAGDDELVLDPVLASGLSQNPFVRESRVLPIQLGGPAEYNYVMELQLPAGYAPVELPRSAIYKLLNDAGEIRRVVTYANGRLSMVLRVRLTESFFMQEHYPALMGFFDMAVRMSQEQIVFKKK